MEGILAIIGVMLGGVVLALVFIISMLSDIAEELKRFNDREERKTK